MPAYRNQPTTSGLLLLAMAILTFAACNQLPRIDPTGQRIFLPAANSTSATGTPSNCLDKLRAARNGAVATSPIVNPFAVNPFSSPALNPAPVSPQVVGPAVNVPVVPVAPLPQAIQPLVNIPITPVNTKAPPCEYQGAIGSCLELRKKARELGVPANNPNKLLHRGERGELALTPAKIVAPVGSEVVVLGGICGGDGYFVPHQPIEFNLSQDSVGQLVDSSSRHNNPVTRMIKFSTRKDSTSFLNMMTSLKDEVIDRGTPTPVDDIHVAKGQAWVSVSSASPGTSYITAVAPKAEAWDKRLRTTEIQWVDALWNIPTPVTATSGAKYPLTTQIRKADDGLGVDNWKVRYEIAGGAPAEFEPSKSQVAEVKTGPDGNATVEIKQPDDQQGPGTTFIRVDIIRPANNSAGYEVIESAVTQVRWVAAALTIKAIGPKTVGIKNPFTYRLEISNPGDQVARESTVTLQGLPEGITFVGSTPKPTEYGDQLVWNLGDVPPSAAPSIIDLQLKSEERVGVARLCFDVESAVDLLKTRACAETQIVAPCLGIAINGPKEARVGDQVTFELTFQNQCEDDLTGIIADVRFGTGIEAVNKSGTIHYSHGEPLVFGQSKTLPLTVRIREEGNHCFQIDLRADGGHTASIRRCIVAKNVNEPSVQLEVSPPVNTAIDQSTRVAARVTNTGNIPLTNVQLWNEASLNSLQPVNASPQASQEGDYTLFQLGTIEPGASKQCIVEYNTIAIDGNAFSRFVVRCDQRVEDQKDIPIRIVGRDGTTTQTPPANSGPIGIPTQPGNSTTGGNNAGNDATLVGQLGVSILPQSLTVRREEPFNVEIKVTNQRAVSDRNLMITLDTPPGIELVQVLNNPQVQVFTSSDGLQHQFSPLAELRSNETASLTVQLRAKANGMAKLTAYAKSDSSAVPVTSYCDVTVVQ